MPLGGILSIVSVTRAKTLYMFPQGGKYDRGTCNVHLVYSLKCVRATSPLVIVFAEPFLGFRVQVRKPYFGFRSFQVPFGPVIPVQKFMFSLVVNPIQVCVCIKVLY